MQGFVYHAGCLEVNHFFNCLSLLQIQMNQDVSSYGAVLLALENGTCMQFHKPLMRLLGYRFQKFDVNWNHNSAEP